MRIGARADDILSNSSFEVVEAIELVCDGGVALRNLISWCGFTSWGSKALISDVNIGSGE